MERMLLATGQYSDQAVITGPTGAGELTIGNLKRQSLQDVYRVMGNSCTLDIDLGVIRRINVVALCGHSASDFATVRVTAGNSPGAATYDSGTNLMVTGGQRRDKKSLYLLFIPQGISAAYWRIEISDQMATYIDIGRLYVAKAFQPLYNMVYGFQQGRIDPSQEYETLSGDSISLKRKKKRVAEFTLEDLTENEVFGELEVLDDYLGTTGDVLFVPKPDDLSRLQKTAIYGKMQDMQPNANTSFDRFSRQFRIKELLP